MADGHPNIANDIFHQISRIGIEKAECEFWLFRPVSHSAIEIMRNFSKHRNKIIS